MLAKQLVEVLTPPAFSAATSRERPLAMHMTVP